MNGDISKNHVDFLLITNVLLVPAEICKQEDGTGVRSKPGVCFRAVSNEVNVTPTRTGLSFGLFFTCTPSSTQPHLSFLLVYGYEDVV